MSRVRVDQLANPDGIKPIKTYTWFQDSTSPFIEFKGVSYAVQDRIIFAGTLRRTPTLIRAVIQVDTGATADMRIVDTTSGSTVVEVTGLSNITWEIINLGSISNLSSLATIWEIQLRTSAANKNVRVSSMDIEF